MAEPIQSLFDLSNCFGRKPSFSQLSNRKSEQLPEAPDLQIIELLQRLFIQPKFSEGIIQVLLDQTAELLRVFAGGELKSDSDLLARPLTNEPNALHSSLHKLRPPLG